MPRRPLPRTHPSLRPCLRAWSAALALLAAASTLQAQESPIVTGERSKILGRITTVGDTDLFGLELFTGDRVKVKVKLTD